MTNNLTEFATDSDLIFCMGTNTSECHPIIAMQMLRGMKRGAKLVVIDPRKTDMAKKADYYLQIPVGYNIPLLNAMMNHIIKKGLHNQKFIDDNCVGFEYVKHCVKDFTPERVEEETGIKASVVREVAELYAKVPAASFAYTMGMTQFVDGTSNIFAISNLALITGQIGRPGTGINPLRGQNNVQGACDMGALPHVIPGGWVMTDNAQKQAKNIWKCNLNSEVGYTMTDLPENIEKGEVKLLYVFGENPVMSDPDTHHFIHACSELDTFIVQDIFLTETAQIADVVLPAACWTEKEGTFLNTSRCVQYLPKAIEPAEGLMPDWQVICEIAKRIDLYGFDFRTPKEVWDEVRLMAPAQFGGITYERIKNRELLAWPCPDEEHPGTPIQYTDFKSFHPDGKFKLIPIGYVDGKEERIAFEKKTAEELNMPEGYPVGCGTMSEKPTKISPCMMTTGRKVYHYHTGTMTRECNALEFGADIMGAVIEISTDIAERTGIKTGDYAVVENKRGKIAAKVLVTPNMVENTIFTTFHYAEADANKLANAEDQCPFSKMNPVKMTIAGIRKIDEKEFKEIRIEDDQLMHPSELYRQARQAIPVAEVSS
ncbi:MAG: molybdopterin-dependent oxidoreductase [Sulfurovum sp.]|nr:molybdopterin-dependent oxidoreductase [Sulfurovum sp.]